MNFINLEIRLLVIALGLVPVAICEIRRFFEALLLCFNRGPF